MVSLYCFNVTSAPAAVRRSQRGLPVKGKFITLVLTLGFLAAFGVFMHSPPSILDGLTGATPKAKRAAQMAAPLEGNYLFCINPALEPFSETSSS